MNAELGDTPKQPVNQSESQGASPWLWELSAFIALSLSCGVAALVAWLRGMKSDMLLGYALSPVLISLLLVGLGHLARFRSRRNRAICILAGSAWAILSNLNTVSKMDAAKLDPTRKNTPAQLTENTPATLQVSEEMARNVGELLVRSIRSRNLDEVLELLDGNRFEEKVLRDLDTSRPYIQGLGAGARKAFANGSLFQQSTLQFDEQSSAKIVKCYERQNQSVVQVCIVDANGGTHYLDAYLFSRKQGGAGIDDFKLFETGTTFSGLVRLTAQSVTPRDKRIPDMLKALESFNNHFRQGENREAYEILNSLPPDVKNSRGLMRIYVQLALEFDPGISEQLMRDYAALYPGDESIIFLGLYQSLAQENWERSHQFIEEIDKAIGGDDYLLWYRGYLLQCAGKTERALDALHLMRDRLKLNLEPQDPTVVFLNFWRPEDFDAWRLARANSY